ncbi:hypothetical protein L0Z72_16605, partial [candidate division KSB1 bacterium]|nr:hypothetical protein [candidate division KSB1 bacterium]
MKKYFYSFIFFFLLAISTSKFVNGQEASLQQLIKNISADSLQKHVEILGQDSLQGRATGTIGERKAANYIARYLELL